MDFAALMKSAMSKDKPGPKPKPSSASASATTPTTATTSTTKPDAPPSTTSKYLRRSELESARLAAYHAETAALASAKTARDLKRRHEEDAEREKALERAAKKQRLAEESRRHREEEAEAEEAARRKRLGLPALVKKSAEDEEEGGIGDGDKDIPEEELRGQLRRFGEPVMLFAEGHAARVRRYKALVAPKVVVSSGPIPTTLELLPESECRVPEKPPGAALAEERQFLYRQLASYFTLVLEEWERALRGRSAEVKESYQGRQAAGAWEASRENMRPLFRAFEKGDVDDKVLEGVVEIANAAQRRRYVDASDAYLRLSIGKAAWPIGVTMVGIHARSAREKLHEHDQKAHIMSDEVTRKYLQAIKQTLTFAQTRWPPDDHLQLMG